MQENPLISVMMLAYNHGRFVRQAVESVLMQQCSYPFEIVVCDDCSTDNTREVCLSLQKEYPAQIRLIFNEKNKGVIHNYFDTMRQCKGKYIADCAADDYWLDPLKLQKQVDILEQQENIIMVVSAWKDLIEKTGEILDRRNSFRARPKQTLLGKDYIPSYLNQKGTTFVLNINTGCFRRDSALSIYDEYHPYFDEKKYPCEDFQLICLMLSRGTFYYMDEELSVYRMNEDSVGRHSDFEKHFEYLCKKTVMRMELAAMFDAGMTTFLSIQSYMLATTAFKAKRSDYARRAKTLMLSYNYSWGLKSEVLYRITVNRMLLYPAHWLFLLLRQVKRLLL